jgi:ribosomal protein S14
MLSAKKKDLVIRNSFNKIEKLKKIKKVILINFLSRSFHEGHFISLNEEFNYFIFKNSKDMRFKNKVRMVNRCVVNNRGRGVFRPFGISRVLLRNLIQFGLLPGYSKAVW